jgi:hypothetical protein
MTNANLLSSTASIKAVVDGFDADAQDPARSPIRGVNMKFVGGKYFEFGDEINVDGKQYAVIDRLAGWQKLEQGCPPEYVMQIRGEPRPARPDVPEANWPLSINGSGKREHPYKWTQYLRLLDIETGELSTFWSNTTGGNIAIGELSDQVSFMREVRPNAIAVIALDSSEMPNEFRTKRPRFRILGWREREGANAAPALPAPEQKPLQLENNSPADKPVDAVNTQAAASATTLTTSKPPNNKKTTAKRGVTRVDTKLKPMAEPTMEEILDDEIGI